MSATTIVGNTFSTAVTAAGGQVYRQWIIGDTGSATTGGELVITKHANVSTVFTMIPAPTSTAPSPWPASLIFREARIKHDECGQVAALELIYRDRNTANVDNNAVLTTDSVLKQLDVGVITQPIQLHPYFSSPPNGLTSTDHWLVNELLTNAVTMQISGTSITFQRIVMDSNGVTTATTAYLTGKAGELAIYRLHGVESYYIPAPVFRLTKGHTNADFTDFGAIGMRQHPGYSLPGGTTSWLKTAYRADDSGSVERTDEEWTYSQDGWDTLLNHLYTSTS